MTLKQRLQSVEMSPLAKRGLLFLALIMAFFAFERVTAYNAQLKSDQRLLQTQLEQLRAIEQSEDPEGLLTTTNDRVDAFEANFFQEETIGLNTAKFQVELLSILQSCGAEQTTIDIQTSEAEDVAGVSILDASVRMRANLLTASRCLDGLNKSSMIMEVDSLRWNMPQQFIVQVRAFALVSGEAGS